MAHACIYTLEPLEHGGVMAKVRVIGELQRRFKHEVNLLFTATEQVPTDSHVARLRYFLSHPRPYWARYGDFTGLAFPHWPLPIWATYFLPWVFGRKAFADRAMHVVISGANQCGLPAALSHKRYIVWIGTLYADELSGKALTGDRWAQRMLTGFHGRMLSWEERVIFERAAVILTNGAHTAARVREVYPQVADKVRVAIYPVDVDVFHPDPNVQVQSSSEPYLLFTARINDIRKNVGMLFRAYARVREQRPDVRLVLTGDAPDANVRQQLAASGVADHVEFVGRQPVPDLVKLYQGAELFVLASNQEGLGISMLEALACGLPVVATRCGGPESVIADGETGYLVPLNDDAAMADCILTLLADPEHMERLRAASAALARRSFSHAVVGGILLKAFQDVYPEYFPN